MHRDRNALAAVMGATASMTVVVMLLVGFVAPADHDTICVTTTTNPSATTTTEPCVTTNPSSTTTTKP